jgi:DNA-binding LacI/PurR family transcriptional regulator
MGRDGGKTAGITIVDVARSARVSKTTVSRVLNDQEPVSPTVRRRVEEAVKRLGYIHNQQARAMKVGRTRSLGLLLPDFSNPFYSEIFKGIEAVARRNDLLCSISLTGAEEETEGRCIRDIIGRRVEGIIFFSYHGYPANLDLLAAFARSRPVVVMDPVAGKFNLPCLLADGFEGTVQAVAYLLAQGRRRVGFIRGPGCFSVTTERFQGYLRGLKKGGVAFDPDVVTEGDFTFEGGYQAAETLWSRPLPPDAVMAATDVMAIGAMRYLVQGGIKVPQEVAVVGFDDIPLARLVDPPLTTVGQPILELGRRAAELIVKYPQGGIPAVETQRLACRLVVRSSTDSARPRASAF